MAGRAQIFHQDIPEMFGWIPLLNHYIPLRRVIEVVPNMHATQLYLDLQDMFKKQRSLLVGFFVGEFRHHFFAHKRKENPGIDDQHALKKTLIG